MIDLSTKFRFFLLTAVAVVASLVGCSGPVTITVRVMDTHAHVVPDVSLTI